MPAHPGLWYQEAEGLWELCQHCSQDQTVELVVLELVLAMLSQEMWSWVSGRRVKTWDKAVTLVEGFWLGQVEDEKLHV